MGVVESGRKPGRKRFNVSDAIIDAAPKVVAKLMASSDDERIKLGAVKTIIDMVRCDHECDRLDAETDMIDTMIDRLPPLTQDVDAIVKQAHRSLGMAEPNNAESDAAGAS
jgi:hypothetical protein